MGKICAHTVVCSEYNPRLCKAKVRMSEALDTVSPPSTSDGLSLGTCARCGGPVEVRSRHLIIDGPAVRTYCSQSCATRRGEITPPPPPMRRRYSPFRQLLHVAVGLPMLVFTSGYVPPKASE